MSRQSRQPAGKICTRLLVLLGVLGAIIAVASTVVFTSASNTSLQSPRQILEQLGLGFSKEASNGLSVGSPALLKQARSGEQTTRPGDEQFNGGTILNAASEPGSSLPTASSNRTSIYSDTFGSSLVGTAKLRPTISDTGTKASGEAAPKSDSANPAGAPAHATNPSSGSNIGGSAANQSVGGSLLAPDPTITWGGGNGANANVWNRNGNWVGGAQPTSTDTAQFDNTANGSNLAPSIGATNTSVGAILFPSGTTNAYNISGTATLTIGSATVAGITNASATNQQFSVSNITLANGVSQTWNVQSTGNLTISSAVNLNSNNLTLSGSSTGTGTISGVISGASTSSTLTKSGTGTWTISGANTYSGNTTVNGGTLLINGSTSSSSNVTVNNSGTTLGGTGTIGGTVTVNSGANIAPGNGGNTTGILNVNGALTLQSGSNFRVDINGTTVGTGYDQLGSNMSGSSGTVITGSNIVVHVGATLTVGDTFIVLNRTPSGPITGTFAQGSTVVADNGYIFSISYTGGTGNDVVLTLTAVPEPSTWLGGALAFAVLGFAQRRRFARALIRLRVLPLRLLSPILSLVFAFAISLPSQVNAEELKEARVTQIIQDVKLLRSNTAPRPAAINDNVRRGTAVETGVQSRSELTFKDKTITRLGEKTIFSVGEGARTIDLNSGQFLLYVPKNSGGAKVKMGTVTAGITGTTVLGTVNPNGTATLIVLEGSACVRLDSVGQALRVHAGQKLTFDPIANRLEDPVDVDLSQVLTSPLIKDFRRLPSAALIEQEVQRQHGAPGGAKGNAELTRAVKMAGANSTDTATPDQFMRGLNSLFARASARQLSDYVGAAVQARPDLADRIVVAALKAGRRLSCDEVERIIPEAIAAHPAAAREIVRAATAAAPLFRDCIVAAANLAEPCQEANTFVEPVILNTINAANTVPGEIVSPEQPPSGQ